MYMYDIVAVGGVSAGPSAVQPQAPGYVHVCMIDLAPLAGPHNA